MKRHLAQGAIDGLVDVPLHALDFFTPGHDALLHSEFKVWREKRRLRIVVGALCSSITVSGGFEPELQ